MSRGSPGSILRFSGHTVRCRTLRFLSGELSQAELGQKIGVTRQTIAAVEAGKYSPTLEAASRIAEVFDKPLGEVLQWTSNGPSPR